MEKLRKSRVAVFGIGGVGGYVCEALVRSGVGAFDLIDDDKVCLTNLNRQIIATRRTVGKYKTDVMKERILEINPDADVRVHKCFFLPENAADFPFDEYDYVVDAVDTVTAKISLVMKAQEMDIPIISSMGAGNKLDGSQFRVADIYKTKVCPLAKVMRKAPPIIAQELAEKMSGDDMIEKAQAAGGYLNFFLNREKFISETVSSALDAGEDWGKSDMGKGKTVLVEYSSPNIAKPFHIGHLFSTAVGNSLSKIYKHLGYDVQSLNHLGDWGTQFGKLIVAY